jgi:branched-subunit amino acid transport protein
MALCAFATRFLPLVTLRDRELPGPLRLAVGYVPVAVLAAMVVPSLVSPAGHGEGLVEATLVGGAVTLGIGLLFKRMLTAAFLGVVVFFLVIKVIRGM